MTLRMCEVVLYQEHFEEISKIQEMCEQHKTIKQYAIGLHDKDTDEVGNLKKPHYHVYLHFDYAVDVSKVASWFSCAENAVNKIKRR